MSLQTHSTDLFTIGDANASPFVGAVAAKTVSDGNSPETVTYRNLEQQKH